ncbi:MAG: ParA family protein [Bdellovibrionales bacterium]|nr:ParA family protein [Bdellovibrionales bacterium]
MKLIIIDNIAETRALLTGRANEALRQADLRTVQIQELDLARIETFEWGTACGCLIGPGCVDDLESIVERLRVVANVELGVVLENDLYSTQAVLYRKHLQVRILALGDLVQIADFIIDCDSKAVAGDHEAKGHGIVGVCQMKGGVGATTVAAGLAACWARHGLNVAAIDFDDVNPQLTAWARVGLVQRTVTAELLRQGEVPASRINEIVHPVEGFEGRLVVIGQPEAYNESFHFKANVLEGAPSASEFVSGLLEVLNSEFDVIVIDMARSWGVATFAALPYCEEILLITDDDGMSVRRTLDAFERLKKESDDPEEFDLSKWSLILNGYTGKLISPKEIAVEIQEMELFSAQSSLYTIPFSDTGRQWGAPGQTFYDTADPKTQQIIRRIACNLIPFRYDPEPSLAGKLIGKFQGLVGPRQ